MIFFTPSGFLSSGPRVRVCLLYGHTDRLADLGVRQYAASAPALIAPSYMQPFDTFSFAPLSASSPASRAVRILGIAVLAVACVACGKKANPATSQVGIKINGDEVSMHQVDLAIQRQAASVSPDQAASATQRIIDNLVDEELAAQAARKLDLDKDPRVVQLLEANKRETLARAFIDRKLEKAAEPTSAQIDAYYNEHPALFNDRRVYLLQETTVAVTANHFDALRARVESAPNVDKMTEAVRLDGSRFAMRQITVSAEDLPFGILDKIAALKEGQSLMQPREGGARIITVLQAKPAPIARSTANRVIIAFLNNENRNNAMKQEIKSLRDAAKIDYSEKLTKLTQQAASAAAQSAPAASASSNP